MLVDKKIPEKKSFKPVVLVIVAVCGLMLLASGFTAVGFVVAHQIYANQEDQAPIVLKADSSAGGDSMSFATGVVSRDIEGLFVLDHLTGNLQCWLLNPNTGSIGGIFRTNVNPDFGSQKAGDSDYVMVAGRIDITGRGRANNMRPGASIVYVGDGNTGKVFGYGFQFDPQAIIRGDGVQQGTLEVVTRGLMRGGDLERDQ